MLTIGQAHSTPTEINVGRNVQALMFTANEEYLVTGDEKGVGMWQVKDGTQVACLEMDDPVLSLMALKNGKWIAAGTTEELLMWNTEMYKEEVIRSGDCVYSVHFSPDSMQLIAVSNGCMTGIWDLLISRWWPVRSLDYQNHVIVAKYSPWGDHIATATKFGLI